MVPKCYYICNTPNTHYSSYEFHIFPSFTILMASNCKSIIHLLSLCMHMGISAGIHTCNTIDTFIYNYIAKIAHSTTYYTKYYTYISN